MNLEIARLVADAYGLGKPSGPPVIAARGEQGRLWRLTTRRGPFALKELLMPQLEADAAADVAFQRLAVAGGLPMPVPIVRRDGNVITEVPAKNGSLQQIRMYNWVDLMQPDLPPSIDLAGSLLGRLHALERPAGGSIHPWYREPVGEEQWQVVADAARAARQPWLPAFEACLPAALAGDAIVAAADLGSLPPAALRRCHLDFNVDNVLLDQAGGAVIVDWENSGPAPDDGELAMSATDFARQVPGAVAFVRAYRESGGTARVRDERSFALALAVQNHLIEWNVRRAIAVEATDEDRVRSGWRLGQLAENLLTAGRVDELLAALRPL